MLSLLKQYFVEEGSTSNKRLFTMTKIDFLMCVNSMNLKSNDDLQTNLIDFDEIFPKLVFFDNDNKKIEKCASM